KFVLRPAMRCVIYVKTASRYVFFVSLCLSCTTQVLSLYKHLVPFLPQLHTFLATVGPRLAQEDKLVVYEAIAHVISAMPMDQAAQSLRTFALDLLSSVHQLATKVSVVT